jgi:hypothetical protein
MAWYDGDSVLKGYTDGNSNPTTQRVQSYPANLSSTAFIMFPVRKNDYWKVTFSSEAGTEHVWWIPLGT